MKILTLLFMFTSLVATAGIPHGAISFKYQTFDGQVVLKCKHVELNEWFDWYVYCGDKLEKKFTVHLKISKQLRTRIPKTTYEILYWITDKTDEMKGTGSSVWFNLYEDANFQKIQMSQSTDNDTAGLYLTVNPY